MKIGQEVEFKKDFKIETLVTGTKLQVKEGDRALVTSQGFKILTGEAKGKINAFNGGDKTEGYDYENIAKMIYKRINGVYGIENFLDDEDISFKEFLEEIEDVLVDIL